MPSTSGLARVIPEVATEKTLTIPLLDESTISCDKAPTGFTVTVNPVGIMK